MKVYLETITQSSFKPFKVKLTIENMEEGILLAALLGTSEYTSEILEALTDISMSNRDYCSAAAHQLLKNTEGAGLSPNFDRLSEIILEHIELTIKNITTRKYNAEEF